MKKKQLIIILVGSVLIISGVAFFQNREEPEPTINKVESESASQQTEQKLKKYDFAQFTIVDAINFIREENIPLPNGMEQIDGYEEEILEIIRYAYENPDDFMPYNHAEMYALSLKISERVQYYMN